MYIMKKQKGENMSNLVNDQIIERAIADAELVVTKMSDTKVEQVGFINYGVKGIHRDCLIEKVANTFYNDYMEMGV
jgi:hypothetical protein